MRVHRAESGASYAHSTPLYIALRSPDIWPDLADTTGIRPAALRAFLPSGEPIREDAVREVADQVERAGVDELYVYDLDVLTGQGDGEEALMIDVPEEAAVPDSPYAPCIRPSLYLSPAITHHSHLASLLTSLHTQRTALSLAHTTLHTHIANLSSALAAFTPLATRELSRQATLLRDHHLSMEIMGRVKVHPEMRRMREGKWIRGRETLGDFVRGDAMKTVEEGCRTLHRDLSSRWAGVLESHTQLQQGAEEVRRVAESLVPREADECYRRATHAFTRIQEIVSDTPDDDPTTEEEDARRDEVMQELRALDHSIREDLRLMTTLKNRTTSATLHALRQISSLESHISRLPPVLKQLEAAFRSGPNTPGRTNFAHVQRVRKGLLVYGATVVEIVRRKEFAAFFLARAHLLSDLMTKLTAKEHKRRQSYRTDVHGQLPFDIRGLDEPVPSLEVTTHGVTEGGGEWGLERSDVDALMELAREMERLPLEQGTDESALSSVDEPRIHPATEARLALEKLIERMDGLEENFDRMAERSLLSASWAPQGKQRTMSEVSGHREALEELRELKRLKAEQAEASQVAQEALEAELQQVRAELATAREETEEHKAAAERTEAELRSARALADSDRSVRQTLERRHGELRADLSHKGRQLEQALAEGTAQTKEIEALRTELHHAREEFERLRALQEESAAEAGRLLRAQAEVLRDLEEARGRGEDLEARIEEARREGERAGEALALAEASAEKERLLRAQASEADRRLRDQRAEADGDRAVLERHYFELTAQVERLDTELREAKGAGEVCKADLEEARERLKQAREGEEQAEAERAALREESGRVGRELECAAERAKEREALLGDVVRVAAAFRDTNSRLLSTVQASNVMTKMVNGDIVPAPAPKPAPDALAKPPVIDPAEPVAALVALRAFDLGAFADAVLKTGSTIRRWQKNTREYRDRAKARIAYRGFSRGDVALFLPTRNNVAKPWAAFNVGFPHYFLQQTPALAETLKNRDWLVAKITSIKEFVADSRDPANNPYSLIDGLKFHMLEVELVNLTDPPPRRSRNSSKLAESTTLSSADSMMASLSSRSPQPLQEVSIDASPALSSSSVRPPSPTRAASLIDSVPPQPFSPLPSHLESIPSPPVASSIERKEVPADPIHSPEASPPASIPFTAPQLPIPASTQHTLLTDVDIRPPSSKSVASTPSRGSFSSTRGGRPQLFSTPSSASPAGSKASPTTALVRTSDLTPRTPSPADSFGAGLDAVRRSSAAMGSGTPSPTAATFANAAASFGATLMGRKPSNTAERRESNGAAADLLRKFNAP